MLLMLCSHFNFYLGVYHGKSYPDIAAVKSRDVALNDNYQYLPVTEKRFSKVVTSFLMLFTLNLLICSGVFVNLSIPLPLLRYHVGEAAG